MLCCAYNSVSSFGFTLTCIVECRVGRAGRMPTRIPVQSDRPKAQAQPSNSSSSSCPAEDAGTDHFLTVLYCTVLDPNAYRTVLVPKSDTQGLPCARGGETAGQQQGDVPCMQARQDTSHHIHTTRSPKLYIEYNFSQLDSTRLDSAAGAESKLHIRSKHSVFSRIK